MIGVSGMVPASRLFGTNLELLPVCRQFGAYREFREPHLAHGRAILNV